MSGQPRVRGCHNGVSINKPGLGDTSEAEHESPRALRLKFRTEHILLVVVITGSLEHGEAIPITVTPNSFKCVSE